MELVLRSPQISKADGRPAFKAESDTKLSREARMVLAQMPDPVLVLDKSGNLVWSADQRFDLELGLRANAILKGINPQDLPAFLSAIRDCLNEGGVRREEIRIQVLEAEFPKTLELEFALSRLKHCKGQDEEYVVASLRNLEGRKAAQSELENALSRVSSASEAKGRFLADMSHELRTPLNSICGFSDMLSGDHGITISDEIRVEYAGLIRQSADHLLSLLNDLLDLARIEAGKQELVFEPTEVSSHLLQTMKLMQPLAEKRKVKLACDVMADLPTADLDARAVRQMVMNLVSNAIKHAPEGGEVVVRLSRSASNLRYEVKDCGQGMTVEQVRMLGERFSQGKTSNESNGLGLSIVFGLVELHGGRHAVRSKPSRGTTVSFDLPIWQKGACRSKEPFENLVQIKCDSQLKAAG